MDTSDGETYMEFYTAVALFIERFQVGIPVPMSLYLILRLLQYSREIKYSQTDYTVHRSYIF